MYIRYEGSPKLGYASLGQVIEFTEKTFVEKDEEQLFPTTDPAKIQRLGKKAFKQMARGMTVLSSREEGRYVYNHDAEELGIDRYELGVETGDPELGTLINLDSIDAKLSGEFGAWVLPAPHYTPQVKPIAEAFLAERKAFMGVDNRGDL